MEINVDVVIPTYRPDEKFNQLLKRLGRQTRRIRHIHVINTKSDHFPEEVEQMPGVIVRSLTMEQLVIWGCALRMPR